MCVHNSTNGSIEFYSITVLAQPSCPALSSTRWLSGWCATISMWPHIPALICTYLLVLSHTWPAGQDCVLQFACVRESCHENCVCVCVCVCVHVYMCMYVCVCVHMHNTRKRTLCVVSCVCVFIVDLKAELSFLSSRMSSLQCCLTSVPLMYKLRWYIASSRKYAICMCSHALCCLLC